MIFASIEKFSIVQDMSPHGLSGILYLPAMGQWYLSIWDHSSSTLLVNMIPLICSYGEPNDLLAPFRYFRDGNGLGSLFSLRGTDEPMTRDPTEGNLTEFILAPN